MRLTHLDYSFDWYMKECHVLPRQTPGKYTREEVIELFGRMGGATEIELKDDYWGPVEISYLKKLVEDAGLISFSYVFTRDLALPDPQRQAVVEEVFGLIDRTVELGAPYAMIISGLIKQDYSLADQRRWMIEGLRKCVEHAESAGIILFCENIDWPPARPFMGNGRDCRDVCRAVDSEHFKLCFDFKAPLFSGEDALVALDLMGPYLCHTHGCNVRELVAGEDMPRYFDTTDNKWLTAAPLDSGLLEVPAIFEKLRKFGYDGTVTVEYQGIEDPMVALPKMYEYFREVTGVGK